MTGTAYVFAPSSTHGAWRWCVCDDGAIETGQALDALAATLGASQEAAVTAEVVLVLPGEDVLSTRVTVPTRSRRQIDAALPFLVEEFVAEDIEQLHLVAGDRDENGAVPVHVLRPSSLRERLEALADAGLTATAARVDHDALDAAPLEIWIGHDRALVRGPTAALAADRTELVTLLSALMPDAGTLDSIRLAVTEDADAGMLTGEIEPLLALHSDAPTDREALGPTLETALAERFEGAPRPGLELLAGPFRPARRTTRRRTSWRLAAGVVLAWFMLDTGLDGARTAWLETRTEALRTENLALFTELVPGRTRSPDPRRELEAMLGDTPAGDTVALLPMLGVVAAEIRGAGGDIQVRSINWNTRRGDLALDLTLSGIAQVDRMKARLEAGGFPVTVDSAVQEQSGVRARVRVGSGGTG